MTQQLKALCLWISLMGCSSYSLAAEPVLAQQAAATDEDNTDNLLLTQEIPVESIQRFVQIYALVKENYVDEKPDDQLFEQAIRGLVGGLDKYSRYLSAEDYKQLLQYTEGDLASVDFDLQYDKSRHQWYIQGLRGSADSLKLGLANGMLVYKLDNQELKGLNPEQVRNILYGSVGTVLNVQISPSSPAITVVRNKKIEIEISQTLLKNQALVIKVPVFQQETANEIKNILEEYARNKQKINVVLFDLRNNPGGLLSAAVETADLFLNNGVIVSTKSRSEGSQTFQALPNKEFKDLKLGILINHRSASAAEVFTAALKDHSRAWVMGEKSYGKGVVQKLFPLPNGAAIQMTVSHYFTPNGSMIDGIGIEPNEKIPLAADVKESQYIDNVTESLLKHQTPNE